MDSFLIDYLKSGRAWVLVGSGPSIQMGYPSWEKLASLAIESIKSERTGISYSAIDDAMKRRDFPKVFEEARAILGGERLLQILQSNLAPSGSGEIYKLIARWPVPVYLTTNYDNEIQTQLAALGECYIPYSNSEDHFGHLLPDLQGAVVKLHGDLRSETGLILTTSQYRDIVEANTWEYWRTKMQSIFQMNRVIVIGHSLSDKNIQHVLEAAKKGAGVQQPICWIAPDVSQKSIKEFLETYRIRVISYENRDGDHSNLVRLIENISEFVPSRAVIPIQEHIAKLSQSPLGNNAAAPGFFVFNKLAVQADYDQKRIDIIIAAIQSTLPVLSPLKLFTLEKALELAGWPKEVPLGLELAKQVRMRAIEQGLLVAVEDQLAVGDQAEALATENKTRFEHIRERFRASLRLRVKRGYPSLSDDDASTISSDIEASLAGFFKAGGLSLATTLFSSGQSTKASKVPSSIIKFINEASARYNDLLRRQAFFTVSVEAFVHAGSAERDYLGRISQGFFAFHSLGAFGDVAIERLKQAKETVWLIDSNAQIPALAVAASTNPLFIDCFSRLRNAGIRLFTTEKLFDETREHLWFANKVIKENGQASPDVIAAAMGQVPYRKSNQFLEGFIRWQSAGNQCDWESYLFQIFGHRNPGLKEIKQSLNALGLEVIAFDDWPGFSDLDFQVREEYTRRIMQIREDSKRKLDSKDLVPSEPDPMELDGKEQDHLQEQDHLEATKKAQPEAEALVIITREREGKYYVLSKSGEASPSWFISRTAILNNIEQGSRVVWQVEAFLRFASELSVVADAKSADLAFETLLWGLAQSGISLLDEKIVESVFGGIIDQATLKITEQRQMYEVTLQQKYGKSLDDVLEQVPPLNRPLAAIQLAKEIAEAAVQYQRAAEELSLAEGKRRKVVEKKLEEFERFRKKMEDKREKGKRKAKKQKAKSKKKKK